MIFVRFRIGLRFSAIGVRLTFIDILFGLVGLLLSLLLLFIVFRRLCVEWLLGVFIVMDRCDFEDCVLFMLLLFVLKGVLTLMFRLLRGLILDRFIGIVL